jgi:hypothetical protein
VAIVDDFRSVEIVTRGKRRMRKARGQEKGHRQELLAFVDLAAGSAATPQPSESVFWSSALTLQVPVALGVGRPVPVELPEALGGLGSGATATSPSDPLHERSSRQPER